MTDRQLDNRIRKLIELEAEKKELEKAIDAIKAGIQESMQDAETRETANFTVRYTFVTTSRFDSKRFKEKHPALYDRFTKQTETRRFSYKSA